MEILGISLTELAELEGFNLMKGVLVLVSELVNEDLGFDRAIMVCGESILSRSNGDLNIREWVYNCVDVI